jgi:hypothetical protein
MTAMLARDARRIIELQQQVEQERTARLRAEQTAAGQKSAILRLQAKLAQHKATSLTRKSRGS